MINLPVGIFGDGQPKRSLFRMSIMASQTRLSTPKLTLPNPTSTSVHLWPGPSSMMYKPISRHFAAQ